MRIKKQQAPPLDKQIRREIVLALKDLPDPPARQFLHHLARRWSAPGPSDQARLADYAGNLLAKQKFSIAELEAIRLEVNELREALPSLPRQQQERGGESRDGMLRRFLRSIGLR